MRDNQFEDIGLDEGVITLFVKSTARLLPYVPVGKKQIVCVLVARSSLFDGQEGRYSVIADDSIADCSEVIEDAL